MYFDSPTASAPTNAPLEAAGLASWTRAAETDASPRAEVIEAFLATDEQEDFDEEVDLPDDEIFAEIKTANFIRAWPPRSTAVTGAPDSSAIRADLES
ncbi:hypothetical protein [Nocardioides sp.]|uniref:hypothetical protein n=1 Tax=Nocardioides sp. TaxID=35761 RepID=UPI003526F476